MFVRLSDCVRVLCLHDARQRTVGVEFSIEIHGLIDKVLVGINYIVLTRLGWKKGVLGFHAHLRTDCRIKKCAKFTIRFDFHVDFKLNTIVDDFEIFSV